MYVSSFCYVQVLKHQYSETYTQLIGVYLLPSVDCKAGSTMEWQHGSTWEQKELKMEFGLSKLTYTQTSPLHLKNNTFIVPVVCSILPVTIPQPPPPPLEQLPGQFQPFGPGDRELFEALSQG